LEQAALIRSPLHIMAPSKRAPAGTAKSAPRRAKGITRVTKRKQRQPRPQATSSPSEHSTQPKPSPLLALAGELRNKIYECCAADITDVLILSTGAVGKDPQLPVASPLHHICRQVRREFNGIVGENAIATATTVSANIVDLNFDHLTRLFVPILKEECAAAKMDFSANGTRKMILNVTITPSWIQFQDRSAPQRWCNWLQSLQDMGVGLWPGDIEYRVKAVHAGSKSENQLRIYPIRPKGVDWLLPLEHAFIRFVRYGTSDKQAAAAVALERQAKVLLEYEQEGGQIDAEYGEVVYQPPPYAQHLQHMAMLQANPWTFGQ
jgi:hypothetical protein